MTKDKCGECKFFGTDACDAKGKVTIQSEKCNSFFRRKEGAKPKQEKLSGLADQGYFESIYHDDKPSFLILKNQDFSIADEVTFNGKTFYPREAKKYPYSPYGYSPESVPNREEIFWRIYAEWRRFVDVEPTIWHDVLTACVLLSYQQEKLLTTPYIYVYGDNESGKSTVLQLLSLLCYRPMYGVTIPSADLYGYLEDTEGAGCILEDELQGINKDTDKVKIYKAGYKQGAKVPRTILLQHDRIIKYYNTFCFKACASEQIPTIKGFRERFLELAMTEGYPEKEWADNNGDDFKRFSDLRNLLLKWRMLSRSWQLPEPELAMRGRLKELWKPLLQMTHGLTVYDGLARFVEEQKNERLGIKQNTLEGHIVKVVTELHNQAKTKTLPYVPFQAIWQELAYDLDAKMDDKRPNQMDTAEFLTVSKAKVGYRLKEVLNGQVKPIREGSSVVKGYMFDQKKLRRIARKYGYDFVTELPIEPTSEGVSEPKRIEKDDGDNVEKQADIPQELSKLGYTVTNKPPIEKNEKETNTQTQGKTSPNSVTNEFSAAKTAVTLENVLGWLRLEFQSGHGNQVLSIQPLNPITRGTCPLCSRRDVNLVWQIQFLDESRVDACCIDCSGRLQDLVQEFEESA